MTVATRSAYPRPVDELVPAALALAEELGEVPSRNRLMTEFRIGAPKAGALLERLAELADVGDPPDPVTDPWIHAVPVGPDPAAGPADAPVDGNVELQRAGVGHPVPTVSAGRVRRPVAWPVLLLALPAFVAIWAGWVDLGRLTGFGPVNLLPGITDRAVIDTAITLPIGMETYAAYALWVWLSGHAPHPARRFARWSAIAALTVGAAGQVAYHLMTAAGWHKAPLLVTALVACLPVAVLGMGAALAHLLHADD